MRVRLVVLLGLALRLAPGLAFGLAFGVTFGMSLPPWSPLRPAHAGVTANERASQLDDLFAKLHAASSDAEADPIVAGIWSLWNQSGSEEIDELMQHALTFMTMGAYGPALQVLDAVIQQAPGYAEGWNRRATVLFIIGQHDRSLQDCEEVLRREPRHFGALAGMAMIAGAQGRDAAELAAYRRALKVNPFLKERQEIIPALERKVEGQPL
jgi:tetratricopeptide (TPR) repeat protein